MSYVSRREFIKITALAATGVVAAACAKTVAPTGTVKPAETKVTGPTPTPAPVTAKEAPGMADQVKAGKIPPVAER